MLALTLSRQSVKHEDKYNSIPSELLSNANLQTLKNLIFRTLLDSHINQHEAHRNEQ